MTPRRDPSRALHGDAPGAPVLSRREVQVLTRTSQGATAGETGRLLHISVDTVKSHLRNIYVVLGARNAPHAVVLAHQTGELSLTCGAPDEPPVAVTVAVAATARPRDDAAGRTPLPVDLHLRFPSIRWGEREWASALDDLPFLHRVYEGIARRVTRHDAQLARSRSGA